jgi:hypothetical protein
MITYAFSQKWVKLAHWDKAFHTSWCQFIFSSWRVSLAEYILVFKALFPFIVADGQMYYGYCNNCLYPAMGDN